MVDCLNFAITNFQISSRVTTNVAAIRRGIYVEGGDRLAISGGIIWNIAQYGILCDVFNRGLISDVVFTDVGQGTEATRDVFAVSGDSDNNTFSNLVIWDNATNKSLRGITLATGVDNNLVTNNKIIGVATPIVDGGSTNTVARNKGYVTENSGTATITAAATTVVVAHGLAAAPTRVFISPTLLSLSTKWWVTTIDGTNFTINVDVVPGAGTATFDWRAQVGEG